MLPPISPCESKEEKVFILQWTNCVFIIGWSENDFAFLAKFYSAYDWFPKVLYLENRESLTSPSPWAGCSHNTPLCVYTTVCLHHCVSTPLRVYTMQHSCENTFCMQRCKCVGPLLFNLPIQISTSHHTWVSSSFGPWNPLYHKAACFQQLVLNK